MNEHIDVAPRELCADVSVALTWMQSELFNVIIYLKSKTKKTSQKVSSER
jgi:cob(I)alamin adenosyltransferase